MPLDFSWTILFVVLLAVICLIFNIPFKTFSALFQVSISPKNPSGLVPNLKEYSSLKMP